MADPGLVTPAAMKAALFMGKRLVDSAAKTAICDQRQALCKLPTVQDVVHAAIANGTDLEAAVRSLGSDVDGICLVVALRYPDGGICNVLTPSCARRSGVRTRTAAVRLTERDSSSDKEIATPAAGSFRGG